MKRLVNKTVGVLLIILMLFSALTGCGNPGGADNEQGKNEGACGGSNNTFFPEGYTCGFPSFIREPGRTLEYWWVETYEECLSAIDLLKSHGSTFVETAIFSADGENFDTKFCFVITHGNRYTEEIKFGDNPFDRLAFDVRIVTYAFLDDVTIDEINYGDIQDYNVFAFNPKDIQRIADSKTAQYEWQIDDFNRNVCCVCFNDGMPWFNIINLSNEQSEGMVMSDECVNEILNSVKIITPNGISEQ